MVVCSGCKQKFPHLDANHCSKCLARKPGLGPPEIEHLNVRFQPFYFSNFLILFLKLTVNVTVTTTMRWMWAYGKQIIGAV